MRLYVTVGTHVTQLSRWQERIHLLQLLKLYYYKMNIKRAQLNV